MLPPQMDKVRQELEAKGDKRALNEDQLLEELTILDQDPNLQNIISRKSFNRIVSGSGGCSCCGR